MKSNMKTPHSQLVSAYMLVVSCLALSGCAMNQQPSQGSAAPTMTLKTTTSTPVIFETYKKVATAEGSSLYFINVKNGDTVASPLNVQFGLRGMGVAPAGVEKAGTGHHHLLVDVAELDVNNGIPMDDKHRHFGTGQTEVSIALKPGTHTLQLVLGDQNHIPHHPPLMSERITVTVK